VTIGASSRKGQVKEWSTLSVRPSSYGAHGNLGEHERSVRVARGELDGRTAKALTISFIT